MKNIIQSFHDAKERITTRYEQSINKAIGYAYILGDSFYQTASGIKSGFIDTVSNGNPDWVLLQHAYLDRPLPLAASTVFLCGSYLVIKGKVAESYATAILGNGVLITDMLMHGEPASAATTIPTICGCAIIAAHKVLSRKFGNHQNRFLRYSLGQPMAAGGSILTYSFIPMFAAGIAEGNVATAVSSAAWEFGAFLTALLPSHHAESAASLPLAKNHKHKTTRYTQRHINKQRPNQPPVRYKYRKTSPKA